MLIGKKLMCLTLLSVFLSPSTLTTFPSARQLIEVQVDNKEVVQVNEIGIIKHPIQVQYEKKKLENEKKAEEERLKKEKELEEQKKNIKESHKQVFILTYYGATYNECGNNKFITASGVPVREGHIAVPKEIPFGSKIIINGNEYIATDRGSPKYICMLKDGSIRVDIFIGRLNGESTIQYEKRIAKMGTKKVIGELYIKE